MRKFCFALVLMGVSIWVVAPSGAASTGDSVNGGGQIAPAGTDPNCENHFAVNARSGPNGESPTGVLHYTAANCTGFFKADVICVRVVGNRATVLGEFTHTKFENPTFEDGGVLAFYEDNGNPGKNGISPDRQQNTRLTAAGLAAQKLLGCPAPIEPRTQLTHGNLQIDDG
jgi:hypothetical protein